MSDINSPIRSAHESAVFNRLFSMVYAALNGAVDAEYRKTFRKDWIDRGAYDLARLLLQCARPDWTNFADTFWIDPWIGKHLLAYDESGLCYPVELWLESEPLPPQVSDDPHVEDEKVKKLVKLSDALNR